MLTASELESKIEELLERNDALERELKILREENALLKQWRFGRSSERIEPGQLSFLEDGSEPAEESNEEEGDAAPKRRRSKKGGHGRGPIPEHVPREEIVLDVPEVERCCSSCEGPLQFMGEDVTERVHVKPAELVVHRYRRPKYACTHGHEIKSAALPPGVIDGGKYEASVYAYVAVAKYCDHVPLNVGVR